MSDERRSGDVPPHCDSDYFPWLAKQRSEADQCSECDRLRGMLRDAAALAGEYKAKIVETALGSADAQPERRFDLAVLGVAQHVVDAENAHRQECYPGLSGGRRQELEASRSYWLDQLDMALRKRRESAPTTNAVRSSDVKVVQAAPITFDDDCQASSPWPPPEPTQEEERANAAKLREMVAELNAPYRMAPVVEPITVGPVRSPLEVMTSPPKFQPPLRDCPHEPKHVTWEACAAAKAGRNACPAPIHYRSDGTPYPAGTEPLVFEAQNSALACPRCHQPPRDDGRLRLCTNVSPSARAVFCEYEVQPPPTCGLGHVGCREDHSAEDDVNVHRQAGLSSSAAPSPLSDAGLFIERLKRGR